VTKFKDRARGVKRIWKQIQNLEVAPAQGAAGEPNVEIAIVPESEQTSEAPTPELPEIEQQSDEQEPTTDMDVVPHAPDVASAEAPAKTSHP
jgi:hypothetical protein